MACRWASGARLEPIGNSGCVIFRTRHPKSVFVHMIQSTTKEVRTNNKGAEQRFSLCNFLRDDFNPTCEVHGTGNRALRNTPSQNSSFEMGFDNPGSRLKLCLEA